MANERIPEDPYRPTFTGDDFARPARLDNELQPDPELAEGPASGGRIAMFAVGHRPGAWRGILRLEQFLDRTGRHLSDRSDRRAPPTPRRPARRGASGHA